MNFQRGRGREEPEINLIPMIDVLLVILIFLMVTTTYSKFSGLDINLPTAEAEVKADQNKEIDIIVSAAGHVMVNRTTLPNNDVLTIAEALKRAAAGKNEPVIVINADAKAAHQHVVDVMQAAQNAGLPHISFATQAQK